MTRHALRFLPFVLVGCWIGSGEWDAWDVEHGKFDTDVGEGDSDTDADADADTDTDADSDADTDPDPDLDGDGWTVGEGDCNDDDPSVHPGASESIADGVDQDCDGGDGCYLDADVDGYGATSTIASTDLDCVDDGESSNSEDCDDDDATVNPGEVEVCNDGLDNNCDGLATPCGPSGTVDLSLANAKLVGEDASDQAGLSFAVGDVTGDGVEDILVGAIGDNLGGSHAGAAYLVSGPVSGTVDLALANAKLVGENANDCAGVSAAAGHLDGDSFDDLLIGASGEDAGGSYAGAVYLVRGPVSGTMDLSLADAKLVGEGAGDYAGASVAVGDVDGDSIEDLLIGAYNESAGGSGAGVAYLVLGPLSGTKDLSLADAVLVGEEAGDGAGYSVAAGDLDGDGFEDFLVGAMGNDTGGSSAGAGYLVLGPITGMLDLSLADAKLVGEEAGDGAGISVAAGDLNGDGFSDFLVGAVNADAGGSNAGAAYLVLGPVSGTTDLSLADAKLLGEDASDEVGTSVAAGDLNDDGFEDFLVGSDEESAGGTQAGASYLVLGPITGTVDLSLAEAKLVGENSSDFTGRTIATGDVDGDDIDDVLIGAGGEDAGGSQAGAVYVLFGGGL